MVLHDVQLLMNFADRVAILDRGEIRDFGNTSALLGSELLPSVFGLNVLQLTHPSDGSPIAVFERAAALG